MANTFANLLYHVVFSTKHRIPLIQEDVKAPLYEYIGESSVARSKSVHW